MSSEFSNRIDCQRKALKLINKTSLSKSEQLLSLTDKAIIRWVSVNKIDRQDIISSVQKISDSLFFIANKSQEQITEDYKLLVENFNEDFLNLETLISNI